jgi:hypothetical protein
LNYVVWGNGSVSARLWNAIRSDDWAIPHVGLSSLGEIVVWARPDEFPPRNMQTSKGLRARLQREDRCLIEAPVARRLTSQALSIA